MVNINKTGDVLVDFVEYVHDVENLFANGRHSINNTARGTTFGKQAMLRYQYCGGGFFAEGWIGNLKIRIFGMGSFYHESQWRYHLCPIGGEFVEGGEPYSSAGEGKKMLLDELKQHILNGVNFDTQKE